MQTKSRQYYSCPGAVRKGDVVGLSGTDMVARTCRFSFAARPVGIVSKVTSPTRCTVTSQGVIPNFSESFKTGTKIYMSPYEPGKVSCEEPDSVYANALVGVIINGTDLVVIAGD